MDIVTYALSKKYTEKSLKGVGALKGEPCRVTAIEEVEGGNKITLSWTDIDGKTLSESLIVKNGEQGNGIVKVEKIKTVDLVDTYRMTFDDGTSFEYEITNGDSSEGGKIDIVKVNGTELPVVDKAVDIEIPDYIYIGNIEPTDENIILWVNPDETSDTIDIPIEQIKVNGILQIPVDKVVDIKISDYIYIGNTEPTDEDIVLWVNPDESGGGTPTPKGNKGLDGVQISDNETVEDKTWSSKKTSDEIAKVETELKGSIKSLSTYSTEETKVGTWIDGKPIYRKAISFPAFETTPYEWNSVNSLSITGIDEVINARAKRSEDNAIIPLAARTRGTSIEVNPSTNFGISKLILEYTKQ